MTISVSEALSGLDAVPWQKLQHAYGAASDVPELITALASRDRTVGDKTWETLYGNLWHQGTIYEATVHAVPFLVRLLDADAVQEKHKILVYLANLYCGNSYLAMNDSWKSEVSRPNLERRLETELGWVAATKSAIVAGLESYVQQLHGPESGSKIASAYLLGLLGCRTDAGERELSISEEIADSCEI